MLRLMRDHAASWIIKFILGVIVIVFVFWGVPNPRSQKAGYAAFVNEEPITTEEYRNAYNRLVERYRQFGTKLDADMIKRLEKQALDGLIDEKLLVREAANLNLRVSEEEIFDSISKMTVFQTDGKFDKRRYERVLNANRLTPEIFEFRQKQATLTNKVRSLVLDNVKVSDNEATEWFKWNDASVSIEYVIFEPAKYKDIEPPEEELKEFYEKNKESYKTEPEVNAQFLRFSSEAYLSKAELTDEEVQDYYDANPEEFKTEKTVEARHILLKLEKDSTPEIVEEKKNNALEIMKLAKEEDKDFAELAKEYSEGPTKDKGGLLGAFKKGDMVKPFSDKAFSMKSGEISDPVKTQFGWHIIKVEKVNEESTLSLDESKDKITTKLKGEKAKGIAYDEAEAFYDSVFEGDNLAEIAKTQDIEVKTTDFFTKTGPRKDIKSRREFATAAFNLQPMEISEVKDFGNGYYILQVLEKNPAKISDFKDVEKKVRADFIREKQDEKASKDAGDFLKALTEGESMTTEGEKYDLTPKATDFFKRNDAIPDIGYEREIVQTAFKLSNKKRLPESPLKGRKGYYVIRFKERKVPDSEAFEKEKKSIKERLLQRKKFKTFDAWLSEMKDRSEITIEADFQD
ncbi:SurA N-terminal domain-containing protein [Desulfococcaceae bacterium HSG8]|nr:SurA N-terminal domain-containing protein [Desulfococcaceae bacterium HSG8]